MPVRVNTQLTPLIKTWELLGLGRVQFVPASAPAPDKPTVIPVQRDGVFFGWLTADETPDDAHALLQAWSDLLSQCAMTEKISEDLSSQLMLAWGHLSFLHQIWKLRRALVDNRWQFFRDGMKLAIEAIGIENAFFAQLTDHNDWQYQWVTPPQPNIAPLELINSLQIDNKLFICETTLSCTMRLKTSSQIQSFIGRGMPNYCMGFFNQHEERRFTAGDIQIFESLSENISTAINIDSFYAQQRKNEHLLRDVQLARQVQVSTLPDAFPDVEGYAFGARLVSASAIGGDFYDVFAQDAYMGVSVCDVAGKGIAAALLAANVRAALRSLQAYNPTPGETLASTNQALYTDMVRTDRFATIILLRIPKDGSPIHYANAGHTTALCIRAHSLRIDSFPSTTYPLGVLPDLSNQTALLTLSAGDTLLLYSDGLTEAENEAGDILGEHNVEAALIALHQCSPQIMVDCLTDFVQTYQANNGYHDDLTLVVVQKQMPRSPSQHIGYLAIAPDLAHLEQIDKILEWLPRHLPMLDAGWLYNVHLAMNEHLSNIMRHGQLAPNDWIHIVLSIAGNQLTFIVVDSGIAYDPPSTIPNLKAHTNHIHDNMPEGGYGLGIIHHVMDTFDLTRLANQCNLWRLTCRLPQNEDD